jgi:hypothetical protein
MMMHWIDPNCLPETQGAVEAFIMNRHGEIDGVILAGARQTPLLVCTPPHMATEIEAAVKIGETIRVRGIRPRRADVIAAVALTASNGKTIIDNGLDEDEHQPRHRDSQPDRMTHARHDVIDPTETNCSGMMLQRDTRTLGCSVDRACRDYCPAFSATPTTIAFDDSSLRDSTCFSQ